MYKGEKTEKFYCWNSIKAPAFLYINGTELDVVRCNIDGEDSKESKGKNRKRNAHLLQQTQEIKILNPAHIGRSAV